MIVILFVVVLGWSSLSFGMDQQMVELRDNANKVIDTVNRQTLDMLKQQNVAFRRPVEEIKQDNRVTYRVLTGLPKEEIQGILSQIRAQTSAISRSLPIKQPEMSIHW